MLGWGWRPGWLEAIRSQFVPQAARFEGRHERIVARPTFWHHPMIEPLLCGIVLGLIPVTIAGLFVAAWNQYRRGSALGG